ncbi:MAG: hypothetical protein FWG66_09950 [Spirochaetes bacterium]|nr:hypothetical protein [Spirochaetota bacterium]
MKINFWRVFATVIGLSAFLAAVAGTSPCILLARPSGTTATRSSSSPTVACVLSGPSQRGAMKKSKPRQILAVAATLVCT